MLSGYMDGELDLVHRMEIERHIQTCPECADHVNNGRAVQTVLRSDRLYYTAPAGLEGRVLTAVRTAERAQTPRSRVFRRPAFAIAAFAALLSLLWIVFAQVQHRNREAAVIHQVTCDHMHSLMVNHLLDIPSADPLAIRTWYSGKLDFAPPVFDLTRQGYPLLGGRLDYVNDNTVAALVYTRKKHVIDLFLWPAAEPDSQTLRQESRNGYQICRWTGGGMTYYAVSDLSPQELELFAESIRAHIAPIEDNCK
jgi:anti-sigma factor RsiW